MAVTTTQVQLSALGGPVNLELEGSLELWNGPAGLGRDALADQAGSALDEPTGYPALRLSVIPGDRVLLVLDHSAPGLSTLVPEIIQRLTGAGVEPADIALLAPGAAQQPELLDLPEGVRWAAHLADEPADMAYLANTLAGRRIYLYRALVEADVVLPVGVVRDDPDYELVGPWSLIFPWSSNSETIQEVRAAAARKSKSRSKAHLFEESAEVCLLAGARLQVALLPGVGESGVARVLAGEVTAIQTAARELFEASWSFRPGSRGDLVVLSVGDASEPVSWDSLTRVLPMAERLVTRGGKIVLVANLAEPPGDALRQLAEFDDPADALPALADFRSSPDYAAAVRLARRDRSSPLALVCHLPATDLDELGVVGLDGPSEIRRLARSARHTIVVNHADLTQVEPAIDQEAR